MPRRWRRGRRDAPTRATCDASHRLLSAQIYVESHLSNTATKFYGELTQQMIKMGDSPGSDNGTGFFQTLASLKIREFYEKLSGVEVEVEAPAKVAA